MKKSTPAIFVIICLSLPLLVQAQGTLYVSNLGQPSSGSAPVASDQWLADVFGTGTNSGGYELNSIQLLMNAASNSPSGFTVSIFNDNGPGGVPGSSLGSLSGSANPSAAGIYTYTASGLNLQPSTRYMLVLWATTPLTSGSYNWSVPYPSGSSSIESWRIYGAYSSSDNGLSWGETRWILQYGIYATAVPEPSALALAGLGVLSLSFWRRKQ
jgi:hypothetical protein